jgi:glutamine amidotransferase
MKKKIGVLNYGIGNISSFTNAMDKLNIKYKLVSKPSELKNIEILVLIGVGSFSSCMRKLSEKGFVDSLKEFKNQNKFLLGICVGMQILMTRGTENEELDGLNFIEGDVIKMMSDKAHPLPHIGWNEITNISDKFELFDEIKLKSNFYFLHSFKVAISEKNLKIAESKYGKNQIIVAIRKGNIFGVQFHPEKSQDIGMKLIKNFFKIANA